MITVYISGIPRNLLRRQTRNPQMHHGSVVQLPKSPQDLN